MCDLIDLNSPEPKDNVKSKLASPLIPVPTNTECSKVNNIGTLNLCVKNRKSLENNPFDMVLHETTEYIRKKDDPFEIVLEKALKAEHKVTNSVRSYSVEFMDDFSPKCRKRKILQACKLNKTLDESQIIQIGLRDNRSVLSKLNNIDIFLSNEELSDTNVPPLNINGLSSNSESADLSILNQSVMNDSLIETSSSSEEHKIKSLIQKRVSLCIQKGTLEAENGSVLNNHLKPPILRRSFSHSDKRSPKKSQLSNARSHSLVDTLKNGIANMSNSAVSMISVTDDLLNDAFVRSGYSSNSGLSSLSNISAITRLNSVSSRCNSLSSMTPDGTMNQAFVNSCSSAKFNMDSAHQPSVNATPMIINTPNNIPCEVIDLAQQLNELKTESVAEQAMRNRPNEANNCKTETIMPDVLAQPITVLSNTIGANDKLLDIDVFTPERNSSDNNNSCSRDINISSDSVFSEQSKFNKSIVQQAKVLARTFEELAQRADSGSSTDDLLSNNPLWTSELLPAFDDEVVDDLIELPTSPNVNGNINIYEKKTTYSTSPGESKVKDDGNSANADNNTIKSLEKEFIDPISPQKKGLATALLLDLKKLVKMENNSEADNLMQNLEKVLGIECKNNTKLLSMCLQSPNDLSKSPQKTKNRINTTDNVKEENITDSKEDNADVDSMDNVKELEIYENLNCHNPNIDKDINKNKNTSALTVKTLESSSSSVEHCSNKVCEDTGKENGQHSATSPSQKVSESIYEKDTYVSGENAAMELLINLGKLLSGECEKPTTVSLIKSLGAVLNLATKSHDVKNGVHSDNRCTENSVTSIKNSTGKLSVNTVSKVRTPSNSSERTSMNRTPPRKIMPSIPLSASSKTKAQLKSIKKRFPSDPGFEIDSFTNIKRGCIIKGDVQTKTEITSETKKPNSLPVECVKNKLKKNLEPEIVKKGPMKAIIPLGKMQRGDSIGRRATRSMGVVTPPNTKKCATPAFKITSSTPNSVDNEIIRKSPKTKPIASSTPDTEHSKTGKKQIHFNQNSNRRNFSCDISPVPPQVNTSGDGNIMKSGSKTVSKLSSPKRATPKSRQTDTGIPKYLTSPAGLKKTTSVSANQSQRFSESLQQPPKKIQESRKNSPTCLKRTDEKRQQSPLKDSNKIPPKIKAVNLISKLRQHDAGTNVSNKENGYA